MTTDGLTVARLINVASLEDPDFAYGILILVHSGRKRLDDERYHRQQPMRISRSLVFLLLFLLSGIFYQRIANIIAFFISAVILTIYVVAHYFARRKSIDQLHSAQATIRLVIGEILLQADGRTDLTFRLDSTDHRCWFQRMLHSAGDSGHQRLSTR